MGNTSDWFARQLGLASQQAPAPPQAYGVPQYAPQQYGQPQPVQGFPASMQQALAVQHDASGQPVITADTWNNQASKAQIFRAGETDNCPNCQSINYFHRDSVRGQGSAAGGKIMRGDGVMMQCAPICMDCGYNGRFEQFGNSTPISTKAPVQVDAYSASHVTEYNAEAKEWVRPGERPLSFAEVSRGNAS